MLALSIYIMLLMIYHIIIKGKTIADAKGDVFRGLEVVETVCQIGKFKYAQLLIIYFFLMQCNLMFGQLLIRYVCLMQCNLIHDIFIKGNLLMGETAENLSRGLDTYTYRQPLGVTGNSNIYIYIYILYDTAIYLYDSTILLSIYPNYVSATAML